MTILAQRCTAHEKSEHILESLYCEEVHSRELGISDAVNSGWQEPDIPLAFCEAFVSNYERGILTFGQREVSLGFRLTEFMSHAARYERDSGQSCADLIHRLDSVFRSRPPASQKDRSTHSLLKPCHSSWTILEAQALLFCATKEGLRGIIALHASWVRPKGFSKRRGAFKFCL